MRIDILTLFPDMIKEPLKHSLIGRAQDKGILDIRTYNIRDYATDRHHVVDDIPYGGGAGMVMMVEPLYKAIKSIDPDNQSYKIIMDASGELFNQNTAKQLMVKEWLLIVCGHYKGVDERIKSLFKFAEISIGDYVLTGGEIPALAVVDAVARLFPGVIKEIDSAQTDSYFNGLLGYPEYTRPSNFLGMAVPEILTGGNHEQIRKWRLRQSLKRTAARRPDLLLNRQLDDEEKMLLSLEDKDVESN
ncbi:MAG: tRNA (guanosine(37)-N1)-methyltransferase TrmD [candidate division Zixibacteria bacterium]|nr:tRNA (guanosine(37)-N1)-methyltransferase TrmD [candidate division Zixibacteria bacterium]